MEGEPKTDRAPDIEDTYGAVSLLDLLIEEASKEMDNSISIGMVRVFTNVKKRIEPVSEPL
jgi:hypothetical protein